MTAGDGFGAPSGEGGATLAEAAARLRETERAAAGLSQALSGGLRRAIEQAVSGGGRLGDVVRRLAGDLSAAAVGAAVRPVGDALGRGAAGVLASAVAGLAAAARGGARGFARGGVVLGAARFATADGQAVMGEAGPEAILPLARGADGRLGVRGGGVAVTLNVQTPDVESFARSRGQVAAALARAVDIGRRRL